MNEIIKYLNAENINYEENVSFKKLTTYKTGGIAKLVVYPESANKLIDLLNEIKNKNIKYKIFGNGSNILASDNEYNGIIIKLKSFNSLEINEEEIKVEAGYNLVLLANQLSKMGYKGIEFAAGIPGTVGGAVYMNAGAYKECIYDVVKEVECFDGENIITLNKEDIKYDYRHTSFMENDYIILKVTLHLEKADQKIIMSLVEDRKKRRIQSQPLEYPSAGSVYRNPKENYAGKLIEDLGLKGKTFKGAKISDKHANFIINYENAKSSDIKYLMDLIENSVFEKYNIRLKREQELFNWE